MKIRHFNKAIFLLLLCLFLYSCKKEGMNPIEALNTVDFNTNMKAAYGNLHIIDNQNHIDISDAGSYPEKQIKKINTNLEQKLNGNDSKFGNVVREAVLDADIHKFLEVADQRSEVYRKNLPETARFGADQVAILETIIEAEVESYLSK